MINIKVEVAKNDIPKLIKDIDLEISKVKAGVDVLGQSTAEKLKENIEKPTHRGSVAKELSNAITVEKIIFGDYYGVGIGRIDKLPVWWAVFEWGGYVPLSTVSYGTLGYFESRGMPLSEFAGTGKGDERWIHTGDKKDFYMKPRYPIKPHRYLYYTVRWLRQVWSSYWIKNTLIPIKGLKFIKTSPDLFGKGYLWGKR